MAITRGNALVFTFVGQDRFSRAANAVSHKLGKFGKLAAGISAAVGVMAVKGTKAFLEFDDQMTRSLAIMGNVSGPMRDRMEKAARSVATTTRFSAAEAAESYFFLASAGMSAEQSIAAMPQVAKFAQAGMFDMARATELAVDAQKSLGMASKDPEENLRSLARVTDVLVGANTRSNATTEQFSEALTNKAGPALRSVNKDIEEGVAVLAALADQGLKGRAAGLSLSILLRELSRRALTHADAMEKANIQVFDASGNMRNMGDIIADLERRFDGMSDAQLRSELMMLGFTDRSIQVILNVLGMSDAIKEHEEALKSMGGVTDEIANKQMKSFQARLDVMKSHAENASMAIGKTLVTAVFTAGETIGEMVSMFKELPDGLQAVIGAIGGVAVAAPIAIGGLKKIKSAVETLYLKYLLLGTGAKIATISMGLIGAALVAGATILAVFARQNIEARQRIDELRESLDRQTGAITDNTREVAVKIAQDRGLLDAAERLGIGTDRVIDAMLGEKDAISEVNGAADEAINAKSDLEKTSAGLAGVTDENAEAALRLKKRLGEQNEELTEAQRKQKQAATAMGETENAQDDLATAVDDATGMIEDQEDAISDLIKELDDLVSSVYGARDANRDFEAALDDARESAKENGKTLDITTEKGRANEQQLDKLAQAALKQAAAMLENGASHKDVQKKMEDARAEFIKVARQMGVSKEEANRLADSLGLIPGNYKANIDADTSKAQKKVDSFVKKINNTTAVLSVSGQFAGMQGANFAQGGGSGGMDVGPSGFGFPLPRGSYRVGSPYGPRSGGFHTGQDFPVPVGTPVFAPFSGHAFGQNLGNKSYGKNVRIQAGPWTFIGAHLSRFGKLGSVRQGQVIGFSGNTGRSTGPHLHAEFRRNGKSVNPRGLLAYARGGFAKAGQFALVGERGPELVKFNKGARVFSNKQSQQMVAAAPPIVNVRVFLGNEEFTDRVTVLVDDRIENHDRHLKRRVRHKSGGR